jgi:TonB family protein
MVDFADNMCVLQRDFASDEAKVLLGFKPGPLSDSVRIILVWKGNEKRTIWGNAKLSFDDQPPVSAPFKELLIAPKGVRVLLIDAEEPDLAPLKTARQFRIHAGTREHLLAPTNVAAAMNVLEDCKINLLESWGMTREAIKSIETRPKWRNNLRVFQSSDYPDIALRKSEQGTAGVRFWVSNNGKVHDCVVVESSGSPDLDAQTCSVLTARARYEPARTKSGEAVESLSFARIRWLLPDF